MLLNWYKVLYTKYRGDNMKILCSDFDNTLYFKDDILKTAKNIESVRNFIAQGNIFCIITDKVWEVFSGIVVG